MERGAVKQGMYIGRDGNTYRWKDEHGNGYDHLQLDSGGVVWYPALVKAANWPIARFTLDATIGHNDHSVITGKSEHGLYDSYGPAERQRQEDVDKIIAENARLHGLVDAKNLALDATLEAIRQWCEIHQRANDMECVNADCPLYPYREGVPL